MTSVHVPSPAIVRRPAPGVKLIKNVRIPMSDGVRLAADLYVPDDGQRIWHRRRRSRS